MDDRRKNSMYAFPAVQEQEQLQLAIQSLAPLRRELKGRSRHKFENLLRRFLHHLPTYSSVNHLTPMEFILLGLIIELLEASSDNPHSKHPPFP
jgi:hypothetical protein